MSTPDNITSTTATPAPKAVFSPFRWLDPEEVGPHLPVRRALELIGQARDVAAGVAVIMAVLEQQAIDAESADEEGHPIAPLFNPTATGHLQRLAITSLHLLHQATDDLSTDLNVWAMQDRTQHPTPKG